MKRLVIAYAASLATMLALDGIWLGVVAKDVYRQGIGPLMADEVNLVAAALFYLGYPLGLVFFATHPPSSIGPALMRGALLGLFAYGTYDLTNLATLRGFPAGLAIIDMLWGGVISAAASAVAAAAARRGRSS
jgi:uncharacterized membrane protein